MKNNSLAMVATISLVVAIGSLIGYIEPSDCTVSNPDAFMTCEEAAAQHIWVFWIFGVFGVVTLFGPRLVRRFAKAKPKN